MKAPSICQSLLCPDPVSFPVLSQIKPQAPDLLQIGNANFPRFRKGLGLYLKQQIKSATHNHLVSEPSTCASKQSTRGLAADCPISSVVTIPEAINLVLHPISQ